MRQLQGDAYRRQQTTERRQAAELPWGFFSVSNLVPKHQKPSIFFAKTHIYRWIETAAHCLTFAIFGIHDNHGPSRRSNFAPLSWPCSTWRDPVFVTCSQIGCSNNVPFFLQTHVRVFFYIARQVKLNKYKTIAVQEWRQGRLSSSSFVVFVHSARQYRLRCQRKHWFSETHHQFIVYAIVFPGITSASVY